MKDYLQTHLHIASHLVVLALALAVGAGYAEYSNRDIESYIHERITKQEAVLLELSEITDRNGADVITEKIIADCPRRNEYEALLTKLGSLLKKDLIVLQGLSESCGSFYEERKALMVAKMDRELTALIEYTDVLRILNTKAADGVELDTWKQIVALEKVRSTLLIDQNIIQENIITALISGATVQSTQVADFVHEAEEINQLLSVHDQMIDEQRKKVK